MSTARIDRARLAHELSATVRLALPLIGAQLAAIGSNVVDAMLAGHLGAHTLGAVAVGGNVWSMAIVISIGVMMAVPASVSHLDGAQRRHEVGALLQQVLWIAWVLGAVLWWAVRHTAPLLTAIGVTPDLRGSVQDFLHAISWGAPALTMYFALRGLSEGLSLTRPSLYFSLGGLMLLAPLGYVLMYGKLGLPAMGARGSGIATATVLWIEMLGFALYIRRHPNYRGLGLEGAWQRPRLRPIGEVLHLGMPMAASLVMEAGLFSATGLVISRLGDTVVAGHQVALNVVSVAFMVPLGLAMAITIRVGNAAGRRDRVAVRYAGFGGIGLTLITQLVSCSLLLGLPGVIAGLYTRDAAVVAVATQLLVLAGIFQFSDGIQAVSNGALRGLKDTRVPMLITAFAYWLVGMPVGWWLSFHAHLGARGMWIGLIAGLSMAAVLLFARFYRAAMAPGRLSTTVPTDT
ncbi:MATE family efflux transporter [Oleiagrimonas sp. C23AA]|uniref:MATE family efflux transporter n=1 Tax=Oleiagrimonas sp. C23AA TaxID=2719047 RepID=UPI001422AB1E|nr:MATE family efflux transporter [Oleiagrimonas sp. C23AA]NII11973.1 MATE family efflux transporter [Oleiagrimonas sp. C23AA]